VRKAGNVRETGMHSGSRALKGASAEGANRERRMRRVGKNHDFKKLKPDFLI